MKPKQKMERWGSPSPAPNLRSVDLDHIIVKVNDRPGSVAFYTDVLGFASDGDREPFSIVRVSPHLTLQLAAWGTEGGEHYAFSMPADEFERIFVRIKERAIEYGDAFHTVGNMQGPGQEHGSQGMGKSVYFFDPNRHLLEIRCY